MKNKYLSAGLCLCSLLGLPLQAANQNTTSDVTLTVTSNSQLTTGAIGFQTTNIALTGTQSYWSAAQNWTFSSTDSSGYTVTVTDDAGPGTTSWNLVSGGNNIAFVLVTNKQVDGTNTTTPLSAAPNQVNPNAISTYGGRIVTPNTTPDPNENILFDTSTSDTTPYIYTMFGAIAQAAMATLVEGAYTKTLNIELVEK